MNEKRTLYLRTASIALLLAALGGLFLWLCYDNMINPANAVDPAESASINTISSSKTIQAARGDITDRYGRTLVTNKAEYVVTLNVDAMGSEEDQANTVLRLMQIATALDVEWNDSEFPVSTTAPYEFTTDSPYYILDDDGNRVLGDDGKPTYTRLYTICQKVGDGTNQKAWATAQTSAARLVQNMSDYFGLSQDMNESTRRSLLGILYSAYLRSGTEQVVWTDYYFAEDVDIDFITMIKEENLPGVEIESISVRDYKTDYAAHLLGQVGAISAEKWAQLKEDPDNPYNMNDFIGLSGMESAFEEYLRGVDGTQKTTYDADGNVIDVTFTKEPQVGSNVTTTLDIDLQEVAEQSLAKWTDSLNNGVAGSAAVVLDAKDSSVLTMASYPTFSAATYSQDYKELSEDERLPLYNRALLGVYAPGSTYKICTATAAISSGVDTLTRQIKCTGTFNNSGTIQTCWYSAGHGLENLSEAIRDSCNIYFYTVGLEIGIDYLTEVAQSYGLGMPTGIELAESTGVNAGPEFAASIPGGVWYPGNVTSAAIGQSDNQFTVLQLANYIAAFARGGTVYDAHLVKNVKNNANTEIIYEHESQTLSTVELSEDTREAIVDGMGQVIEADKITFFQELEDSGVKVGCKTGTAELGKTGLYNAVFVAFAPIKDPEIVVCTVVEKSPYSGAESSCITADIMDYYFSAEATLERVESENQLLR